MEFSLLYLSFLIFQHIFFSNLVYTLRIFSNNLAFIFILFSHLVSLILISLKQLAINNVASHIQRDISHFCSTAIYPNIAITHKFALHSSTGNETPAIWICQWRNFFLHNLSAIFWPDEHHHRYSFAHISAIFVIAAITNGLYSRAFPYIMVECLFANSRGMLQNFAHCFP